MAQARYERHYEAQDAKITVDYLTDHGQYHAAHWQNELEMIYLLNGNAEIALDGQTRRLVQGEFIVIDSNHIYELRCPEAFMQISVHVDREFLALRAGRTDGNHVGRMYRCSRDELTREQIEPYLEMCELFKQLVPLYIDESDGYRLKTESIVLDILYHLVQHFSIPLYEDDLTEMPPDRKRIQSILKYVEDHYREPLTLAVLSNEFGVSREHFSRLFHRSVGIPLMQHVFLVRMSHFYHDLISTDEPVMELLEKHGITNYKLFSKHFKEIYGGTPREIRRRVG